MPSRRINPTLHMLETQPLSIPDVRLLRPARFCDARGYFTETYHRERFAGAGIESDFVQDNQSYSAAPHTVRGLHYQAPPHAQAKLVRVLSGAILDVAVDIRSSSPTYGRWVKSRLDAREGWQIFVPRGFLHGFVTLEPDTLVAYKADSYYDAASEGAIVWSDETLAIDWEIDPDTAVVSAKDAAAPAFRDFHSPF